MDMLSCANYSMGEFRMRIFGDSLYLTYL